MTPELAWAQLRAFYALIAAVLIVTIGPIAVTGLWGKTVADSLIAMSDKTVTGLVGVLGTLVGVMWQSQPRGHAPQPVTVTNGPADPVPVEPQP